MKHNDAPYRRWNPTPTWLRADQHPPERGQIHTVKKLENGEPFQAYLSHNGVWLFKDKYGLSFDPGLFLYWLS